LHILLKRNVVFHPAGEFCVFVTTPFCYRGRQMVGVVFFFLYFYYFLFSLL